jgi:hypothetical protein
LTFSVSSRRRTRTGRTRRKEGRSEDRGHIYIS